MLLNLSRVLPRSYDERFLYRSRSPFSRHGKNSFDRRRWRFFQIPHTFTFWEDKIRGPNTFNVLGSGTIVFFYVILQKRFELIWVKSSLIRYKRKFSSYCIKFSKKPQYSSMLASSLRKTWLRGEGPWGAKILSSIFTTITNNCLDLKFFS